MTSKISVRLADDLMAWLTSEAKSRKSSMSDVVTDAIRLAAAAAEIKQTTQLLGDFVPLISARFDRLESYTVQAVNLAGAVARQAGVFDQAQAEFERWKKRKEPKCTETN